MTRTVARPFVEARRRKRPRLHRPDVPVFREDGGTTLEQPWVLNFITCAAPYAPDLGQPESADLLRRRIHRVLAIARAYR